MRIPSERAGDVNAEIFCTCDRLQDMAMQYVVPFYRSFGQGWAVETTPGFNRLKPPWSILPKVVNTSQSGQLEILSGSFCFCGGLICLLQVLICSYIEKRKKMNCFVPAKGAHQVAYGLEGVWSLTSVGSTGVDGLGVVSAI